MATNRRPAYNRQVYNGQAYVYGSAALKPEVVPRHAEEAKPYKPKRISRQVRQNRKNAMHMNAAYVVFLAVAAVAALFVCVYYLQLQSELSNRSKTIASLQRELASQKEVNDTRYNNAMDSVNMENVRQKAVGTLGMTHAKAEQIVTYKNPADNYVKKYKNIPKSGVSAQSDRAK